MTSTCHFIKDAKVHPCEKASYRQMCNLMLSKDSEEVAMKDPYVFPNLISDDVAKRVPPVAIMTAEFCFLRTDAEEARDLY